MPSPPPVLVGRNRVGEALPPLAEKVGAPRVGVDWDCKEGVAFTLTVKVAHPEGEMVEFTGVPLGVSENPGDCVAPRGGESVGVDLGEFVEVADDVAHAEPPVVCEGMGDGVALRVELPFNDKEMEGEGERVA